MKSSILKKMFSTLFGVVASLSIYGVGITNLSINTVYAANNYQDGIITNPNGVEMARYDETNGTLTITYNSKVTYVTMGSILSSYLNDTKYPVNNINFHNETTGTIDIEAYQIFNRSNLPSSLKNVDLNNAQISASGTYYLYATDMFKDCKSLERVNFPENFTDKQTFKYLTRMFQNCNALTTIDGLNYIKVNNVTSMNNMFDGCSSLAEINLSGWETNANVTVADMFKGCSSLKKITVGAKTALIGSSSSMFNNCTALNEITIESDEEGNVGSITVPMIGDTIGWIKEGGHTLYTTAIGKDNGGAGTYIPVTKTAGTYKPFGNNGLGYCINYTDNGDVYLIYPINITAEQLEDYNSIRLYDKNNTQETLEEPSTIYTSVKFSDDSVLTASEVGTNYLLAVQIEGAQAVTPDNGVRFELVPNN